MLICRFDLEAIIACKGLKPPLKSFPILQLFKSGSCILQAGVYFINLTITSLSLKSLESFFSPSSSILSISNVVRFIATVFEEIALRFIFLSSGAYLWLNTFAVIVALLGKVMLNKPLLLNVSAIHLTVKAPFPFPADNVVFNSACTSFTAPTRPASLTSWKRKDVLLKFNELPILDNVLGGACQEP